MPQYDKNEIGRVSSEYGFVRDTFEKVIRLKKILRFFNSHDFLKEHLLLKGGTAINLMVFNLPRLSVDIDVDYIPNGSRESMLKNREEISTIIDNYMKSEGYQSSTGSRFNHSLDAFHFNYINAGGSKDMIKIEINYSLRAHVFEPVYRMIIPDVFADDLKIQMVDPIEIFAAKGNALISRAAARDLYDWGNFITSGLFKKDNDMLRKCFAFYTTISADRDEINRYFDTSAIDKLTFTKIKRDLFPVINKKNNFDLESRKAQAKETITQLMKLTDRETEYMDRFIAKEYRPDLLFDDDESIKRIESHPMALWKCMST